MNEADIKISIVVPVYNAEKYLRQCLDSLVGQIFENIEIICINDGSTDNSLEILHEYQKKDGRIVVFFHENKGISVTRNVGLHAARGKYIMFCDSDDWYEPEMCKAMFEIMEGEDVDVAMCNTNFIGGPSVVWRKKYAFPFDSGRHSITDFIKSHVNVYLWNKIFKTDILKKYNIFFQMNLLDTYPFPRWRIYVLG
ncbi:MAG: glycosyltransferase [Puniceicoccales bacterium]|nr:glycosyltransferase [Puniceicoccales bacterium]